jgi:hypothetical protein
MMAHFLGGLPVFGLYVLFPLVSVGYIVIEPLVIDIAFYRLHFAYQKKKKTINTIFLRCIPLNSGMQKFRPLSKKKKN